MFVVAGQAAKSGAADDSAQVGQQLGLRGTRERQGLNLREVARRLEISAGALSQIETGKSRPSVKTLYAIVSELGLSINQLFAAHDAKHGGGDGQAEAGDGAPRDAAPSPIVQRADSRSSLDLDSGVSWDRLTAANDPNVDFFHNTYVQAAPPAAARSSSATTAASTAPCSAASSS